MIISGKQNFIDLIKSFNIQTEYIIIKPNWVDIQEGNFTEPEILEWLFEALPEQKKIVVESYTPWRGLKHEPANTLRVDLEGGKEFWDFYKKQDEYFLDKTGIGEVLKKYNAKYINVTSEYWKGDAVPSTIIKNLVETKYQDIYWSQYFSYVPQKIFDLRKQSTLISLAKIKLEEDNKDIIVSLSVKNMFGLVPHPSRKNPFHEENLPQAIADINKVYSVLFVNSLGINEGIFSYVVNYYSDNQFYQKNKRLIFIGKDYTETDRAVCEEFKINPQIIPYLKF